MWSYAPKLMGDSWSAAAEPLACAHEEKLRACEAWVKNAFDQQRQWAQTVAARAADWPGLPAPMGLLLEQTQAAQVRFLEFQDELWSRWFELCKGSSWQGVAETGSEPLPEEVAARVTVETEILPVESPASVEFDAEDDLCAIGGVGPALEGKLKAAGVHTYRDIAAWSEADIERVERSVLGGRFAGRIRRDDWVDQARWLHAEKYGSAV